MARTRTQSIRHIFAGGWATDFGPAAELGIREDGFAEIPFLVDAENIQYELDGGVHKIGGTTRIPAAASALESGANVTGLYDFWRQGTGGSPAQRTVAHVGTAIYSQTNSSGSFTDIDASLTLNADAVVSYETVDDILIVGSDNDDPVIWDQSTVTRITPDAGPPRVPKFGFSAFHKNKLWAAGDPATPSTLYYSVNLDHTDWTGAGSGTIAIDPSDGDMITGLISYKENLIVFKGPNKGSIHFISGSSPTGSDPFARRILVDGVGAVWQNGIFRFLDDVGFINIDGTIRSLQASDKFGDYQETTLSRPINGYLRETLVQSRLKFVWSVNDASRGCVYLTFTDASGTTNNRIICMDYRFNPVRWSLIKAISAASMALTVNQGNNNKPSVVIGDYSGFIRRLNTATSSLDESIAINAKVTTPYLSYGDPVQKKTIDRASISIVPSGDFNIILNWTRDNKTQQTHTFTQTGDDVLAGSQNARTLSATASDSNFSPAKVSFLVTAAHPYVVGQNVVLFGVETSPYILNLSPSPETLVGYTVTTILAVGSSTTFTVNLDFSGAGLQGTTDVQGDPDFASNFFVLNVSNLAGSRFVDIHAALEEGGEFSTIQYQFTQSQNFADMEIHAFSTMLRPGADSTEN